MDFDKHKLNAGAFIHNNGMVLRTINILRIKYNKLSSIQHVLLDNGVSESEFLDSVNFLAREGYIALRTIGEHVPAALSDMDYHEIEAILTGKGIRLTTGYLKDQLVEV